MTTNSPTTIAVLLLVLLGVPETARSQNDGTATINHIANAYTVVPNITYRTVSNWEAKLDVMQPRGLTTPHPTLIYYHGGGWTAGTKEGATISLLPYLQMGQLAHVRDAEPIDKSSACTGMRIQPSLTGRSCVSTRRSIELARLTSSSPCLAAGTVALLTPSK
jgi:hypothetical protein